MTTWLHFIGQSYYSRASFEREAREFGITRRVSLQQMRRMAFGDRVVLAIRDGASALVFGSFTVTTISGLSPEGQSALDGAYTTERLAVEPRFIERGCGSYWTAGTYTVRATMTQIVETLDAKVENPGRLMVGGTFEPIPVAVRLKGVRHFQGFRAFDLEAFQAAVQAANPRHPTVRGHFYAPSPTVEHLRARTMYEEALTQVVVDYMRAEDIPAPTPPQAVLPI